MGIPVKDLETIELALDELEALRLVDLNGQYQEEAAGRMGVSRPTLGRVLENARRKVADALIHGKVLVVKGGPVVMSEKRIFECAECGSRFDAAFGAGRPKECPSCHATNFHRVAEERGRGGPCRRRGQQSGGSAEARGCGRQERRRRRIQSTSTRGNSVENRQTTASEDPTS